MEIDARYMRRALQLAALGRGHTRSNPMVGAVITGTDGDIIGEGYHHRYGGPHAEVNAINSVADASLLRRSTIYVTLEPCSHFGKTPPCAKLLADCGIPRVVIGSVDPNEKVSGRGIALLRESGAEVITGILEAECRTLNRPFFIAHTLRRPYILLKWAMSADGYMDSRRNSDQEATAFSTPESHMLVHRLRSQADAIMVGSSTVISDNPRLDTRLWPGYSPRPVVLDRRHRICYDSYRIFAGAEPRAMHITQYSDLASLMGELFADGISSLLVEGGPTLLHSFLEAGLWDDVRVEISPVTLDSNGVAKAPSLPSGVISSTSIGDNTVTRVVNPASLQT